MTGWLAGFPGFATLGERDRARLAAAGTRLAVPAGAAIFTAGAPCEAALFVCEGQVRVHLLPPDGQSLVLYRIGAGETCILTTAALLGGSAYPASAVAETAVTAVSIPAAVFNALLAASADFRHAVFAAHAGRITDLMALLTDITFTRIPVRLARCLLARADAAGHVALTHEAIAAELGTVREVVSRNLKPLERSGHVRLGTGSVDILDAPALRRLAEGA